MSFILVINCGSSSLKFSIVDPRSGEAGIQGLAECLGSPEARLKTKFSGGKSHEIELPNAGHLEVLDEILHEMHGLRIVGVGHRVVHGGKAFKDSVRIDADVIQGIEDCRELAPLHNPANLIGIRAAMQKFAEVPHVAVFDTAFHQTMPPRAYLYAIPYSLYENYKVRRYGFHGTSHHFVAEEAARILERPIEQLHLITAHLGNGCSACAVREGRRKTSRLACDDKLFVGRNDKGQKIRVSRGADLLDDNVWLGTVMLALAEVDGLVSGAVHSTANTIRPALQIIKTRPGAKVVSSIFFMCLPDQVLVYDDCAVNPDPDAETLADIAIQSADSTERFGIPSRVAMISYSTGESGSGVDVDKVREATRLAKLKRPDLLLDGPLQYDAAAMADVAAAKAPDSPVAGRATVFVFPDLNTGNTTYKAVQRSANVISIGPMLQGLRRPVNDLSRGALVEDIVYTVAITAIQAGQG
jgi:phosphate acetyltransferase